MSEQTQAPQETAPPPDDSGDSGLAARLAEMHGMVDAERQPVDDDQDDGGSNAHQTPDRPTDDAGADDDAPIKIKLKIDGQEQERALKRSELAERLQKAEAAEKRFAEAAEIRKAAEVEGRQAREQRAHLAQALQHYTQQLAQTRPQMPDSSLLESDPVAYLQQRHAFEQWSQEAQQAEAARAHLAQQEQAERQQQMQARLRAESEALVKAIPEWQDAEKAKAGKAQVRDALKRFGFGDAEIGNLYDSRMVLVAHKAAQYDAIAAELAALKEQQAKAQQSLQERLKTVPPVRAERPGTADINPTDGRTRAMRQLARTGSLADAAVALRGLL